MTTQLKVYNGALALLGERSAVATSDATEPVRTINALYDEVVDYCLAAARWKFAERYASISPSVISEDAYNATNAFPIPSDLITLNAIASDAGMDTPVDDWHEHSGYYYSESSTIHILYVSNNSSFGKDLTKWPETFTLFVQHYLALRAAARIKPNMIFSRATQQGEQIMAGPIAAGLESALQRAIAHNDAAGPTQFLPDGATTKLSVVNEALLRLGVPQLKKLTDASATARVMLNLWDQVVNWCLTQGRWGFAERQATLTADGAAPAKFGLAAGYAKPSDSVLLTAISADSAFNTPADDFAEGVGHWHSDTTGTVYVQYISNNASYGGAIASWPEVFTDFVTAHLMFKAAPLLAPQQTQQGQQMPPMEQLKQQEDAALERARQYEISTNVPAFLPGGATTKLSVINEALFRIGLPQIRKLSDTTPQIKVLLNLWDQALNYCLTQARWRFAERQSSLSNDGAANLRYGLARGFAKPTDALLLTAIAEDSALATPVQDYYEDVGHWFTDSASPIYVTYLSNNASYGGAIASWPEAFTEFMTTHLARKAATLLKPQQEGAQGEEVALAQQEEMALTRAKQYEAASGLAMFLPEGATTQLSIFNGAMYLLQKEGFVKLSDARPEAKVLLNLWDRARRYCLEQGHWKFAEREAKLTASLTEVPTFGLQNAFEKPTDFIRINMLAADEYYNVPLIQVHEKGDFWYAEPEELYLRYVSNHADYGYDMAKWPETFVIYVTLYLATLAAHTIAPDLKMELIRAPGNIGLEEAKYNALSKDAVAGPTQFLPEGRWSSARRGNWNNRGRNSRSSLYGN